MAFSSEDIIPFGQVRARFTELAENVCAGAEKIITRNGESYIALVAAKNWIIITSLNRNIFICC